MIKLSQIKRPEFIIIQVLDDAHGIRGSFTVPIDEELFWQEVNDFILENQKKNDEPIKRIN